MSDSNLSTEVVDHLKAGAEAVERFVEDAGASIQRAITGVEHLIQLARQPKAAPPGAGKEVREALEQFDTALGGLSSLGEQLRAAATKAEVPATDDATGTTPVDATPVAPGEETDTGGGDPQPTGVVPTDVVTDEGGDTGGGPEPVPANAPPSSRALGEMTERDDDGEDDSRL